MLHFIIFVCLTNFYLGLWFSCTFCSMVQEMEGHLFSKCQFAGVVWYEIGNWFWMTIVLHALLYFSSAFGNHFWQKIRPVVRVMGTINGILIC